MKQKDIALILVVAIVAMFASFFLSKAIFASASSKEQKAEIVDAIGFEFVKPSDKYFNAQSINPTQLIQIGGSPNDNPFAAAQ